MNCKLIYLTLLLSSVGFVQFKSYIEVDEDGNEFEVKRFHVQGRQLNDKNQQCVITRRKRSPSEVNARQYGNADPVVTLTAEEEEVDMNSYSDNKDKLVEDTEKKDDFEIMKPIENDAVALPAPNLLNYKPQEDEFEEDEDKTEMTEEKLKPSSNVEKETESVSTTEKPKKEKKEKIQKVTLIRPHAVDEMEEELENEDNEEHALLQILPSSFVSNNAANNFVIVQAPAATQKVPVLNVLPTEEDYGAAAELLPFCWSYENQPISTTAVWSTGDDVGSNIFNRIKDLDQKDYEDELEEFETQQPVRINHNKNKKKKNKIQNNKNRINRYPANAPNRRKPIRKNTPPRPVKQIVRRKYHNGASSQNANKTRKRNQQANKQKKQQQQNKNRGTPLAITSETMITTIDDDPQIECIIINKESTTSTTTTTTTSTTRRPFWNILGRQTSNAEEPRNYGLRKRTTLRFVA